MGAPTPLPPSLSVIRIVLIIFVASMLLAVDAIGQTRPLLTGIEVRRDDEEVKILMQLEGGAPAATQIRFTGGGRVMVLEIAGVDNGMDRRNMSIRDERLELITVENLPGGIQVLFNAGNTAEPFVGTHLEPVMVPTGLLLTIWQAGASTLPPLPPAGLPYDVSEIVLVYAQAHPGNPPLDEIRSNTLVTVGVGPDGFVAHEEGLPEETFSLANIPTPNRFVPSSIRKVSEAIVKTFNEFGIAGVYVEPHPDDIDPESSRDLRRASKVLRLQIWTGRMLEFRTFASGTRVSEEDSVDNPVHSRIKTSSPVQPGDLLMKDEIDEYVARMNRHPGRVIDTSLASAGEPGGAYLDYLVNDSRPWNAYFQLANTGTEGTTDLRERFGFTHNQLTNRDDILQMDYITGDFQEVHAVFGSYDFPLLWDNRVRAKIGGSYVEYDAEQLGINTVRFQGDQWSVEGSGRGTIWQDGPLFVDVLGGIEWRDVSVDNEFAGFPGLGGDSSFFLPTVGFAVERRTPELSVRGRLSNTWNASSIAGTDDDFGSELGGSIDAEPDFEILEWDFSVSAYVDALLSDSDSSLGRPLVHEIFVSTRGQFSWDNVLAPQFQNVSTGFYAVRGYPQSVVAGDDMFLARFEYRLHVPRLLPLDLSPMSLPWIGTFKFQPDQPNGIPDWDLIARVFVDGGITSYNAPNGISRFDEEIAGAGVGLELRILNNFVLTVDYGVALEDTDNGAASAGSSEFHVLGTIVY